MAFSEAGLTGEAERVAPEVGPAEAAELCAEVYLGREEAQAVARRLRAAGWIVPPLDTPSPPRADGTRVVAIVYHPDSYESPGDLRYVEPVEPGPRAPCPPAWTDREPPV